MSRRRRTSPPAAPPRDELAIERARRGLREAVSRLPPERRALLVDTLESAAGREESEAMAATKKGTGTKGKAEAEPGPIGIRLSAEILAAVDKATEKIAAERPDMKVTRADALRVLIVEALVARKIPIR